MISSITIQTQYQKLYSALREYLWPFDTVELIADLEIACYQAFPAIEDVKSRISNLRREISSVLKDDEELRTQFDEFEEMLNGQDTVYLTLNKVKEVISQ